MKKRKTILVLMTLFAVLFISGCKQNVGTPEDNAVVEDDGERRGSDGRPRLWILRFGSGGPFL